jgi:hypothetical protein
MVCNTFCTGVVLCQIIKEVIMTTTMIRSTFAKLTAVSFAAAVILIASPVTTKANNNKEKEVTAVAAKQVSVQYTGAEEGSVLFRVKFDNPNAQKFTLIVKNHLGDILYSGQFNDAAFSKTVRFVTDSDEEMTPVFIIRVGNQQIEQSFSINKSTEATEEVVVTKL